MTEAKEPPLESFPELSQSTAKGDVKTTHLKRGFLTTSETMPLEVKHWTRAIPDDGKVALTVLADRLRAGLDEKGLPTDKWPVVPTELEEGGYHPDEHGIIARDEIWIAVAEESTEPLSSDRIDACLLHSANHLLANYNEAQLTEIFQAMRLYNLHCIVGELHDAALEGEQTVRFRARGPEAKKEDARILRELISVIAKEYWVAHPSLLDQPYNTAKKIIDTVNEKRSLQKPGCKPLKVSTIGQHLSDVLKMENTAPK